MAEAALAYLTLTEWARRLGITKTRAERIVESYEVPGAVPLIMSPTKWAYIVPLGTPLPQHITWALREKGLRLPPPGYISLAQWAATHGKTRHAAQAKRHYDELPTEAIFEYGVWWVPEGQPWPMRKKRSPASQVSLRTQMTYKYQKKGGAPA